jgi:putative peptide zinc metalloprotease protein
VTLARGVIWLPDDSMVRAHTPGFVEEVLAHDGQQVEPGDPIARLSNLSLETEALDVEGRIAGLWVELNQAYGEDSAKALRVSQQIEAAQAARTRIDQRLQHLVLRAPAAGVLNLPRAQDLPGRFLAQGTVVGTLVRQGLAPGGTSASAAAPATWHVRVALEAEQATDIEARASGIAVHLPTPGAASIPATLARDARAATRELPSAALGDRFGGAIVTDPADPQGRTAARDVVLLALELAAPADAGRPPLGQRVWVRFERGLRPLGWTLARRAQQSVLVHFAPLR